MDLDYLDVQRVLYSEKENVKKNEGVDIKHIVRPIESVSDYLRAIITILSDNYIIQRWDLEILKYENLFSHPNGTPLNELLQHDIFFRGESKNYEYQIPSLYRNIKFIQHEDRVYMDNLLSSADQLEGKSLFDTLTLLQHYGSNTRILDITSNALIALYFTVSSNIEDDGYVYILSGFKSVNSDNNIKTYNPMDEEVIVKSALSRLNFKEKRFLSILFSNVKDEEKDIKEYLSNHNLSDDYNPIEIRNLVSKIYSLVQKEMNASKDIIIPVKYLFGYNIVRPFSLDERVVRQSSAFIIFGLEDIAKIENEYQDKLLNDQELERLNKAKQNYHGETGIGTRDEKIDYQIRERKQEIYQKNFESKIQTKVSKCINDLSIMYTPIFGKKQGVGGKARIKIKHNYKKRILDELIMLGINSSSVYPDLGHKTQYINKKYNTIQLPE